MCVLRYNVKRPPAQYIEGSQAFFSIYLDTFNAPYISRALILSSYWDTISPDVTAPYLEVSHTFIDVTGYWRYSSRFIPQVLVPIEYSDNIHCDITAFNASQCYHAWFNSVSSIEISSPTKCALKQNSDEQIAIMLCDMYYCAHWLKQTHLWCSYTHTFCGWYIHLGIFPDFPRLRRLSYSTGLKGRSLNGAHHW